MEKIRDVRIKVDLWCESTYKNVSQKFQDQFGFRINNMSIKKLVNYLYLPKDPSSLAITRILFGIAMLLDIPDERGGAIMDKRWGDPMVCHFPLIPFLSALPMPYMALVYAALWLGALGITLGYKYRYSAWLFAISYWYLFLIEKSYWNNHSYLFGLVGLLLAFTDAASYWSLDVYLDPRKCKQTVPYWNYFILKYQFFILYFMAGLKKGTAEWLSGYSVPNLSEHWVFNPFKLFLSTPQTDYLIVHWFVFVFDLTVAVWMMWSRTRHVAMVFCAMFHLMNSRLFSIGMFPWVCLATMPLFYPFDWPKNVIHYAEKQVSKVKGGIKKYLRKFDFLFSHACATTKTLIVEQKFKDISRVDDGNEEMNDAEINDEQSDSNDILSNQNESKNQSEDTREDFKPKSETKEEYEENLNKKRKNLTFSLIAFYVITQAFLPYSHFITKGYNNWTNGLYGYSWDMMVHTWDIESVVVKVVDITNGEEFYIDPYIYSPNDRWTRHADMVHQYAGCVKRNLIKHFEMRNSGYVPENISIYVDVWCSMNGRFTQRMFDSKVDLLNVSWSPFKPVSYLVPLLDEAMDSRGLLYDIKMDVHSWHNNSDVVFIADFPGYEYEKYIPPELTNVTITVLNGTIAYQPEVIKYPSGQSHQMWRGDRIKLDSGAFHKIINVGKTMAFYMYTFTNSSESTNFELKAIKPKLPIAEELLKRGNNIIKFAYIVLTNIYQLFFQLNFCRH